MVFPDPFTAALVQAVVLLLIARFLDVFEREPLRLLALMALWGACGATLLSLFGNEAVDALLTDDVALVWGAAISAPLVEESAKGLALLAAFWFSVWIARRFGNAEFNGPTDGMVYGLAVGLGFAFAENNAYFLQERTLQEGYELLQAREGFLNVNTMAHGIYTGAFGAGLGLATWSADRFARVLWPLFGLMVAMGLHALHNGLISAVLVTRYGLETTASAFRGEALPTELVAGIEASAQAAMNALTIIDYALAPAFLLALAGWVAFQRRVLVRELDEEVTSGLVTVEDVRFASRYSTRLRWYAGLLLGGRFERLASARRAYAVLAELAFAKWRLRVAGGPQATVDQRRLEVSRLHAAQDGQPA